METLLFFASDYMLLVEEVFKKYIKESFDNKTEK